MDRSRDIHPSGGFRGEEPGNNFQQLQLAQLRSIWNNGAMIDDDSEEALKTIHAKVGQWFDLFADSSAFAVLNESQQQEAHAIVNYFTEYSYNYLDLAPADWGGDAVCECCIEVLPRKVSAELSYFEAISPVLSAFFRFLAAESLHPKGNELAEAVDDIADDIVLAAKDSGNWGPAKQFVMAAQKAGVNIGDEISMLAFATRFNQQRAESYQSASIAHGARPSPANPYDSCPCGSGKKFKFCCRQGG